MSWLIFVVITISGKLSCVCLHGDRKPPERKANLQKFKVLKIIWGQQIIKDLGPSKTEATISL